MIEFIDIEIGEEASSWGHFLEDEDPSVVHQGTLPSKCIHRDDDTSDGNHNLVVKDHENNASARNHGDPVGTIIDFAGQILPFSWNGTSSSSNTPVKGVSNSITRATKRDEHKTSARPPNIPSSISEGISTTNSGNHDSGHPVTIIIEEDNRKLYPNDSYSFLALNGPVGHHWPLQKFLFFAYGLVPVMFQMALLELLVYYLIENLGCEHEEEVDHPESGESSDVMTHVDEDGSLGNLRQVQVTSLLVYMVFPNSTLQDVIQAIQLFPWRSTEADDVPVGSIRVSCILKGLQGNYSLVVVFLLVMKCDNLLEIILNFTAVNFISDLDNVAFSYAQSGAFGPSLKEEASRIAGTKLPACMYRERQHIWHGAIVICTAAISFASMIYLMRVQQTNYSWISRALKAQCVFGLSTLLILIARFCFASCRSCLQTRCCRNSR